jgi:hypothetical protein
LADQKISELTALTGANVADDDAIAIVDTSATETKKIVFSELKNALDTATGFVRITGDTMTGDLALSGADVTFGDNDKAIFGAGSDLQIYHSGTQSYIDENGDGNLYIRTSGAGILLKDSTGAGSGNDMASFTVGGAANLAYNGSWKLATTNTGVDITGTLTADALNVSAASPNIDVTDTGTSHASQDFLTNSNAVRATIGVERSAGGGLFVGSSPYAAVFGTASAGATEFATNNNVRMRISSDGSCRWTPDGSNPDMTLDASGNLFVGKTALGIDTNGFDVRPTGETGISVDSNIVLDLNRTTNDGKIINLRKDDTTVGSIGAYSGSPYIGADDTGISFFQGVNAVVPFNTATVAEADNSIDLGRSAGRFKDLYLSGGVYLGGTGAANKLDDYEEGTWTITDGSGAGLSFTVQDNVYTKVGRLVVASAIITWPSTSDTSVARIVLPFTSVPNNSHSGGVVTEQNWDTSITLTASCNYTTGVIFRQRGGGSLTNANLSGKKLRFSVTYHAA